MMMITFDVLTTKEYATRIATNQIAPSVVVRIGFPHHNNQTTNDAELNRWILF